MQKFKQLHSNYGANVLYQQKAESSDKSYANQNATWLQYINLLDKCTQILREDRIWLRNQIKAGEEDVIIIFKAFYAKKPINMQHLQIKLRKYVTAVKSKAKMEQLTKFKENLLMGTMNQNFEKAQDKKVEKNTANSYSKPHTKSSSKNSHSFNSTLNVKNYFQEEKKSSSNCTVMSKPQYHRENFFGSSKSPTYENLRNNSSLSKFNNYNKSKKIEQKVEKNQRNHSADKYSDDKNLYKDVEKRFLEGEDIENEEKGQVYPPAIEQLSQRSEMNSGRDQYSGLTLDSIKSKMKQQFERIEKIGGGSNSNSNRNLSKPTTYTNNFVEGSFSKNSNNHSRKNSSHSQQKQYGGASFVLDGQNDRFECERKQTYGNTQEEQFDKYDYERTGQESEQESESRNYQEEQNRMQSDMVFPSQNSYNELIQNQSYQEVGSSFSKNLNLNLNLNSVGYENTFALNSSQTPSVHILPASGLSTQNDSLFTSPELLYECRKFIQQKSASGRKGAEMESNGKALEIDIGKTSNFMDYSSSTEKKPNLLSFDYKIESSSQKKAASEAVEFSEVKNVDNFHQTSFENKYNQYSSSNRNGSGKQASFGENQFEGPQSETKTYEVQENTSALYGQRDNYQPVGHLEGETQQNQNVKYQFFKKYANANEESSHLTQQREQQQSHYEKDNENENLGQDEEYLEEQVDEEQQAQQVDVDFTAEDLLDNLIPYIEEKQISEQDFLNNLPNSLAKLIRKSLSPKLNHALELSSVFDIFSQLELSKPQQSNPAKDIFTLLDIDQKGFITGEDIESFLTQLQDAQVQCLQELADRLERIFQISECEGRVVYWSLYVLKDNEQFNTVCSMLEQFEFEIEV